MIRRLILAATLLFGLAAPLIGAEMTADDLIGKYIAASGGEQSFASLKSLILKGSTITGQMTMDMKIQYVMPNKSYTEMLMGGMPMQSIGTNGTDAWFKLPMGTYYLTGEDKAQTLSQADRFPLVNYKKSGAKVKYLGEDLVKGAKAYKLEFVSAANDTTVFFFDATTYYVIKQKSGETTISLSDYRKEGGLMMPHKINISAASQSAMATIDTILVNPAIPDSIFVMPKNALPIDSLKAMMGRMGGGQGGGQGGPGGGGQ